MMGQTGLGFAAGGGSARWPTQSSLFTVKKDPSGQDYITGQNIGLSRWVLCPKWPAPPNLSGMSLARAIDVLRHYYDSANTVYVFMLSRYTPLEVARSTQYCPNRPVTLWGPYHERPNFMAEIGKLSGKASGYPPFFGYIWSQAFPHVPAGQWQTKQRGTYQIPVRRPSTEIQVEAERLAQIAEAWSSIPWPHKWFYTFFLEPKVPVPPVHGGYRWNQPQLAATDYFPRSTEQIKKDMAKYIADHEDVMQAHFNTELLLWQKKQEELMKKAERTLKVAQVFGFVLDILAPGVGSAIVVPIQIRTVRKVSKEQVKAAEAIAREFGITDEKVETFRLWVVARIEELQAPTPEPDPESDIPQGRYLVFVEDKMIFADDILDDAVKRVYAMTETGHRISVLDTNTNEPVAYYIRLKDALQKVPDHISGKVHALPPESAKRVAGAPSPFPIWVPLAVIGAKLLL